MRNSRAASSFAATPVLALALAISLAASMASASPQDATSPAQPAAPTVGDTTRLFYGPTARMLKPGEVYIGDYSVILPFVQVGVTPRFSIGGGSTLLLGFKDNLYWITPKIQLHRGEKTSVALGTLSAFSPGEGGGGLAYFVTTHDTERGAFTVGAGWAYSATEGDLRFSTGSPLVLAGFERRLTPKTTFISENYVIWNVGLATAGVRIQGRHLSADLFALIVFADGDVVGGPGINCAWRF